MCTDRFTHATCIIYICKVYDTSGTNRRILKWWVSSIRIFLYRDSPGSTWAYGSRLHGCTRLAAAKALGDYCDSPTWQDHFGSLVELASLAQSKRQGVKKWKRNHLELQVGEEVPSFFSCLESSHHRYKYLTKYAAVLSLPLFKVTLDDLWRMPLMRTVKEYHSVLCVLCHYHSFLYTFILKASKLWQNMVAPSKKFATLSLCFVLCIVFALLLNGSWPFGAQHWTCMILHVAATSAGRCGADWMWRSLGVSWPFKVYAIFLLEIWYLFPNLGKSP